MSMNRRRPELDVTGFLTIGAMIAGCVVAGLGLGLFVDHQLGSSPVCTFIGLVCGIGAGVTATWFQIRKYLNESGSS